MDQTRILRKLDFNLFDLLVDTSTTTIDEKVDLSALINNGWTAGAWSVGSRTYD